MDINSLSNREKEPTKLFPFPWHHEILLTMYICKSKERWWVKPMVIFCFANTWQSPASLARVELFPETKTDLIPFSSTHNSTPLLLPNSFKAPIYSLQRMLLFEAFAFPCLLAAHSSWNVLSPSPLPVYILFNFPRSPKSSHISWILPQNILMQLFLTSGGRSSSWKEVV